MALDCFKLDDRVALVTGGSKGLGEAMARALAQAGADVAIVSRHEDEIRSVAESLADETGRKICPFVADVTDVAGVEAMVAKVIGEMRHVDILVNNAGYNVRKPAFEQTLEEWDQVMNTNARGVFVVARAVGRHMVERGTGRVINVASMIGLVGLADRPAYTASKGAVINLTRTLALEWAPYGVTVNALCPGPFETPMNAPVLRDAKTRDWFLERLPIGRWGWPEELAGPIVFLASDASSFMTGSTLTIDGGWTAQ